MKFRTRISALVGILLLVEASALYKLGRWLSWSNDPPLAYMTAFAFVCLLLGSIVVLMHDLPDAVQRNIRRGTAVLITVQALANVLISFEHAQTAMPGALVASFFNVRPDWALKLTATIQGATLSLVSLTFWSVIGLLLQRHEQELQHRREELRNLEGQWQEEAA